MAHLCSAKRGVMVSELFEVWMKADRSPGGAEIEDRDR